jgi:alkylated DNA repair dioxygenase AlkB
MLDDTLQALGLTLLPDFISVEEEAALLPVIVHPKSRIVNPALTGRNCIQRYGSRVPYNNYMVSAEIPEHFARLCQRLVDLNLVPLLPDSVTVNEYLQGQVIQPHIDALDGGTVITVLSCGHSADMVFRHNEECYTVTLPPRSLVQLRGDLRYKWTHEIKPVASTRYSLVFRCSKDCGTTP